MKTSKVTVLISAVSSSTMLTSLATGSYLFAFSQFMIFCISLYWLLEQTETKHALAVANSFSESENKFENELTDEPQAPSTFEEVTKAFTNKDMQFEDDNFGSPMALNFQLSNFPVLVDKHLESREQQPPQQIKAKILMLELEPAQMRGSLLNIVDSFYAQHHTNKEERVLLLLDSSRASLLKNSLSQYLNGKISFRETVCDNILHNLDVVPSLGLGNSLKQDSSQFEIFINSVQNQYDRVIVACSNDKAKEFRKILAKAKRATQQTINSTEASA
ncbi:MAG: hypothetical protein HRT45_03470 [Bdellovibrionales bacterium]|nr:hypothetical protein [Bdellovibrionales bacterium]